MLSMTRVPVFQPLTQVEISQREKRRQMLLELYVEKRKAELEKQKRRLARRRISLKRTGASRSTGASRRKPRTPQRAPTF